MAEIAFLGTGNMGAGMAARLLSAGHTVTVYNRSEDKARRWVEEYGGRQARTPALAARGAEFVFVCVGNDNDLHQVTVEDNGAVPGMTPESVPAAHTTRRAARARRPVAS